MNRYKFLVVMMLILTLYFAKGQNTQIDFSINNYKDSTLILGYHYGQQRLILDTLDMVSGKMTYQAEKQLQPGIYFLYSPKFYYEFVVNEPNISIETDVSDPVENTQIKKSFENKLFIGFQKEMGALQKQQRTLSKSFNTLSGQDSINTVAKLSGLSNQVNSYQDSIVDNYSDSYVGEFISLMRGKKVPDFEQILDPSEKRGKKYRYLKGNYFNNIEIVRMMRTPVIHGYVLKYFDELVVPQPDSLKKELDNFFEKVIKDEAAFRYWLVTFFNKYQESSLMGMDAITAHLVENYYLSDKVDWMSDESKAEMQKELRFIKPNLIGNIAPPLNLLDTTLQKWSLSDMDDNFLVLYFYDPECGVCRKKTPLLKDNYDELKNEGAEVVAVCTITDQEKWKEYIQEKELNWINVADPFYKSNFRMDYNVRSTPQVYILNSKREIIAKKLDIDQLVDFIRDYKTLEAR